MSRTKKRGPGRPPAKDPATETVRLRLTPNDAKEWRAAAARAGSTLSAFIYAAVKEKL